MSGAVIGMALIVAALRQIQQVLTLVLVVCFVAVAGAALLRYVAVLIAAATGRPSGATTSGSVSPCSKFFPKKARKRNKETGSCQPLFLGCGVRSRHKQRNNI